ncbi:nitrate- and nitrite sensing domain-containing protein [Microbacterium sp. BWT-B31]|uniref:sensor histidine kinase n=1 Tax=Microbacterium sp. BWT-B31 TaxID=3232072 RepID=UPI003527C013
MPELSSKPTLTMKWWRGIRPRLIGVLLIPMIAALVLGVLRVESAVAASADALRAESLANALPDSFRLGIQLTTEREAVNAAIPTATKERIFTNTDEAIDAWLDVATDIDDSEDPALAEDLDAVRAGLNGIGTLREQMVDLDTRSDATTAYTDLLNTLFGLSTQLPALGDPSIYQQTGALAKVRTASEVLGVVREVVSQALVTGEVSPRGLMELAGAQAVWDQASDEFIGGSSPAASGLFEDLTDRGPDAILTPLHVMDQIVRDGGIDQTALTLPAWLQLYSGFVANMEKVIVRAADDLAADVTDVRQAAQQTALLTAGIVLGVLLVALAVTLLATRSILRPLVRLREAALRIASETLPGRVRDIERADGPVDTSVQPIGVTGQDEIGEVADAFDAVHAEAVRLAGEQAQLRANVNRMFVNLARRSQNLVERQLRLIDQLEAGEQDPAQLANLFQLDNLATRMRRNDESLLVLAGGDTGQAARGDVPVIDVLRAAASEIEQFARVEFDSAESAEVRDSVAGDLVHLLAELIENAASFSPPDTPVVVRTLPHRPGDSLIIEIHDRGIGMTPDELLAANTKLRSTSGMDADVARMMGLVVTARLADRHGMSVSLRAGSAGGVVARVGIPTGALAESRTTPLPIVSTFGRKEPASSSPAASTESATTADSTALAPAQPATQAMPLVQAQAITKAPPIAQAQPVTQAMPVVQPPAATPTPAPLAQAATAAHDAENPPIMSLPVRHDRDDTPIFAALQSEWFTRRRPLGAGRDTSAQTEGLHSPQSWSSPGDVGWKRAAEVAQRPQEPELVTAGGLPKRIPGQYLMPGAAPVTRQSAAPVPRTVDSRRSGALASFQRGVSQARDDSAQDPFRSDRREDE